MPCVEKWLHRPPSRLDTVGTLEQHVVTYHAVIDQCLIAGTWGDTEIILVIEPHFDALDDHAWSGHLGVELQGYTLSRLNPDHEIVVREMLDLGFAEHGKWSALEADHDLRSLGLQCLAGAEVERHSRP